jgi:hypothetical protein
VQDRQIGDQYVVMSNKTPKWVKRGKSIRQFVKELETLEDKSMEVRISLDGGATHKPISIVGKHEDKYCLLINSEESED